jgi:hypothetical protein
LNEAHYEFRCQLNLRSASATSLVNALEATSSSLAGSKARRSGGRITAHLPGIL